MTPWPLTHKFMLYIWTLWNVTSRLQSNWVVYEHPVKAEARLESVTEGRILIKEWACWADVLIPSHADAHTVGVHRLCFPPCLLHCTLPHFAFISVYMLSILSTEKIENWSSNSLSWYVSLQRKLANPIFIVLQNAFLYSHIRYVLISQRELRNTVEGMSLIRHVVGTGK